ADLFASADEKWMDAVANAGKLVPRTRIDLLGNSLVLVARRGALRPVTLRPGFDINAILGPTGRLAVG
ncbi:substrate-binding domain-containing protein, partial [Vibrio parahaemolyticus]